jgi:hypothetical protein
MMVRVLLSVASRCLRRSPGIGRHLRPSPRLRSLRDQHRRRLDRRNGRGSPARKYPTRKAK